MTTVRSLSRALPGAVLILSAACGDGRDDAAVQDTAASAEAGAMTAAVRGASGRDHGTVSLTDTTGGIIVTGRLTGLPPGDHGIHLHAVGACSGDFESAGPHWNPTNRQHGKENPEGPHLGDLSNLTVGTDSSVSLRLMTPGGSLRDSLGLVDGDGAAVIVHAQSDDHKTDPGGAAGDRIACGVISAGDRA